MLNTLGLKEQISNIFGDIMSKAFVSALDAIESADPNTKISKDTIAKAFAKSVQEGAGDLAQAIEDYLRSATITLGTGTIITPGPGLVSAAGPVTGVVTLMVPTTLTEAIS